MKELDQTVSPDSGSQTAEVLAMLEQLLAQLDNLEMAIPAIKVAEAIDCLENP
ncbi:MAG: hypothetical protein ABJO01_13975 [Parasphingorhabdus sp.]|uniref:hypothetical protein n=1 Tax=Parasphingorhabdus sp. TaxID=2709688 RepID=UPI00329969D8